MIAPRAIQRVASAALMVFVVVAAVAAEIPTGQILEKVACSADSAQTYALYVPTTFDRAKKWPILICFDPGARGKAPVERFQAAAEKYGWLVAGSNNSRNGPWEANAAAIHAMLTDLNRHLPLDPKRIYAAGLSGGARVACQLAVSGIAKGVISCSAAFSGSETPAKVPFPFFGTAGVTDFNYRELRRVDQELEQRRAVHRVIIFDGGHEWLPSTLAIDAIAWLELQAMRAGTQAKDAAWIQTQFEARTTASPPTPPLEHFRAAKSVAADFKGLVDTKALEKEVSVLAQSREVRDALKQERAIERAEESAMENLLSAASDGFAGAARKNIQELQAKAANASLSAAERASATRVLQGAASTCSDSARDALRSNEFELASSLLEMVVLLRPERASTHFDLARARAGQGDRKRAIAALQQACALGFKDRTRIENEELFKKLRTDPGFLAILAGLR